jgi:hypothetical protein
MHDTLLAVVAAVAILCCVPSSLASWSAIALTLLGIVVVYIVNQGPTEHGNGKTEDVALESNKKVPDCCVGQESVCWVCCEGKLEGLLLSTGCACSGPTSVAHISCLAETATHNVDSWTVCPACKQKFAGECKLRLARAREDHELFESISQGKGHSDCMYTCACGAC